MRPEGLNIKLKMVCLFFLFFLFWSDICVQSLDSLQLAERESINAISSSFSSSSHP